MPDLRLEDVTGRVVADDRLRDHLDIEAKQRGGITFRQHCARFGIHDLGELTALQLFSLVAARNVASAIDLLRIPKSNQGQTEGEGVRYDLRRRKTSIGPAVEAYLASVPAEDQEWAVLREPDEIPEAIPEDLLLRRLAPREFLRRLSEGELVREAWVQEEETEGDGHLRADEEPTSSSTEDSGQGDTLPVAYLLLDASESMGSRRDPRNEVGRGLALAFLRSQMDAGNPTYLCLFRHELSPLVGGTGRHAFESAVAEVLGHRNEGMTHLQGALRLLSDVVRRSSRRIDIALITDGISRLRDNPLAGTHLHTFLLDPGADPTDRVGAAQLLEATHTLEDWSEFFLRFGDETQRGVVVPSRADIVDAAGALYGIEDARKTATTAEKVRRVQQRLQNVVLLLERYREFHGDLDPELQRLQGELRTLTDRIGRPSEVAAPPRADRNWSPIDRDLHRAIEIGELKSLIADSEARMSLTPTPGTTWTTLGEALRHVARRILRRWARFWRRLLRR